MKKASVALIVLFLFVYILPLGFRPLAIPDEATVRGDSAGDAGFGGLGGSPH